MLPHLTPPNTGTAPIPDDSAQTTPKDKAQPEASSGCTLPMTNERRAAPSSDAAAAVDAVAATASTTEACLTPEVAVPRVAKGRTRAGNSKMRKDPSPRKPLFKKRQPSITAMGRNSLFSYFRKGDKDERIEIVVASPDDSHVTIGRGAKQRRMEDDDERRPDSLDLQFTQDSDHFSPLPLSHPRNFQPDDNHSNVAATLSLSSTGKKKGDRSKHDVKGVFTNMIRRMSIDPSSQSPPSPEPPAVKQSGNLQMTSTAQNTTTNTPPSSLSEPRHRCSIDEDKDHDMNNEPSSRIYHTTASSSFSSDDDNGNYLPWRPVPERRRISISESESDPETPSSPQQAASEVTPTPVVTQGLRRSKRERAPVQHLVVGTTPGTGLTSAVTLTIPTSGRRWNSARTAALFGLDRPILADLVSEKLKTDNLKDQNRLLREKIEQLSEDSDSSLEESVNPAQNLQACLESGLTVAQAELKLQKNFPEVLFERESTLARTERQAKDRILALCDSFDSPKSRLSGASSECHILEHAIRVSFCSILSRNLSGVKREKSETNGTTTPHRALVELPLPAQARLLCRRSACPSKLLRWLMRVAVASEREHISPSSDTSAQAYQIFVLLATSNGCWNEKDPGDPWLAEFCQQMHAMGARFQSADFANSSAEGVARKLSADDAADNALLVSYQSQDAMVDSGSNAPDGPQATEGPVLTESAAMGSKFPLFRAKTLLNCVKFAVQLSNWTVVDLRALWRAGLRIGLSSIGSEVLGNESHGLLSAVVAKLGCFPSSRAPLRLLVQDTLSISQRLHSQTTAINLLIPFIGQSTECVSVEAAYTLLFQWAAGPSCEPKSREVPTSVSLDSEHCTLELLADMMDAMPELGEGSNRMWAVAITTLVKVAVCPLVAQARTLERSEKQRALDGRLRNRLTRLKKQLQAYASVEVREAALGITGAIRTLEILGEPDSTKTGRIQSSQISFKASVPI